MGLYSVEVREATRGGEDYTEEHHDCDTVEDVRAIISDMHEDEYVYSVLHYREGINSNPKDVTGKFY